MHTSHPFAHRTNPDGTVDAICKKCTVSLVELFDVDLL